MINTKHSRKLLAIKNASITSILQMVALLISFVGRTFFVKILGNDYLSCEGLFSNILMILSFSELGIGSAIIYSLYEPIAKEDYKKIGMLMNLFSRAYCVIAVVICLMGISLLPFLKFLVKDVPAVEEEIVVLYLLFLTNSVASYVLGDKKSFLIANQENYIVVIIQQGCNFLKTVIQIFFLYITHNYIIYLVLNICFTLLSNIISTYTVHKKYPWLIKQKKEKLPKDERVSIFTNVFSIASYKVGAVILNGTDNIIIAAILNTAYVGLCSNYNLLINAVSQIINQVFGGIQATIGNHNVTSDAEDRYSVFSKLYFLSYWVFGFCAITLANLLNPFIGDIWLGKDYLLNENVVILLSLSFYVCVINTVPSTYRTTLGFFKEARSCPLIAAMLNIILSIVLGEIIGLEGIFIATIFARALTFNVLDPYLVFKKGFSKSVSLYYYKFIIYMILLFLNYFITRLFVNAVTIDGIMGFIIKTIVNVIVCNSMFLLMLFRTTEFNEVKQMLISILEKRRQEENDR